MRLLSCAVLSFLALCSVTVFGKWTADVSSYDFLLNIMQEKVSRDTAFELMYGAPDALPTKQKVTNNVLIGKSIHSGNSRLFHTCESSSSHILFTIHGDPTVFHTSVSFTRSLYVISRV
jgi:hypothetical protein